MGPPSRRFQSPNPFASLDPSVNIGSASHPFQEIRICHQEHLTRLYRRPCRNFLKNVLITWLTWGWETAAVADQLSTCVVPFRRGLRHHTYGPVQNRNGQCVSNPTTAAMNLTTETWWVWMTSNQPHTARKGERICQALVFFSCGGNPKKRQSKAMCGLSPAEYIEGKGCPLLTTRWLFSCHFKWLMMVFNFGSCYGLLASGNGCWHPWEGSIRTFKWLLRMECYAFRALQCTQGIYQIDGSCFEGPTLANLFDLPWWCDSYGAYVWKRIRALETGVWATIQRRTKT